MKTFARITGVILIALGLLFIVLALVFGVLGGVRDVMRLAGSLPVSPRAGLTGVLLLVLAFGHGVLLAGVGEALVLLANLASRRVSA